jgi:GH15 family glucan-1,4-alpha-glucosidase
MRIEDYAVIGDTHSAALVGRNGSIDWLCLPRFDSAACFAALLGEPRHGRWLLSPEGDVTRSERRYRPDSLVLETELQTAEGVVRLVDCMPIRAKYPDVVRIVEGVRGRVPMRMELAIRFDYGDVVPWVQTIDRRLRAVAGPDALVLTTPVEMRPHEETTVASFVVGEGERIPFVLSWHPSHEPPPDPTDPHAAVAETDAWWRAWASRCKDRGPHRDAIVRSLITLKALTYAPTGAIVASATTSLPEAIGGGRNWDYRYSWLRDATFILYALMHAGYREEAAAWRDWLLRAVAGDPAKMQIMYGVAGERHLDERTIDTLPGYEGSTPVRIGNAAASQVQLDVYGEVVDALYQARRLGLPHDPAMWDVERLLCDWLETGWSQPDQGLWEVRGPRRHFTHSKVMTWVAFDRAIKSVERQGLSGPSDRWRALRDTIHRDVCAQGFDASLGSFTQSYGSKLLDASLLLIPAVGFLPAHDPRVMGTIAAIERDLLRDGFVMRYRTEGTEGAVGMDGLPGGEGAFLACSFWLVDAYVLTGRHEEAHALFERLLALRNDVGLLSEEYDAKHARLVGNFPQAFSHIALVNSARNLASESGPAHHRWST